MKIAFDAKRAYHNRRGLGNYSRDTLRLLGTHYPEATLFLLNPSPKNNLTFYSGEKALEILPESLIGKALPALWRSYGMCHQIKHIQPDIYHGLSQELPYGIRNTGVKSVVTMHDAIFMRYPKLYPATYRTLFVQKNNYACRVADRIIAISEQTKRDFIDYFHVDEKKISVIYQGCNVIFRQPVSEEKKSVVRSKYNLPANYVLNVGSVEKRKNASLIIEAMHRYRMDIPLVIVGKPTPYMTELNGLIQQYEMKKQVIFLHQVETEDLPAIYFLAEIMVYPSIFEGFGIPILEAIAMGTPVISSTGSCFEETGGPFSRYVNPQDADELGYVLTQLLSDKAGLSIMKKEGVSYSERFTDVRIAEQLIKLYKSLL